MKVASLILDFDGVIADTYKVYVDFLVKKLNFSQKKAENRMQKSSTEIIKRKKGLVNKILEKLYYHSFFKFLKNHQNLLFEERMKEIQSIKLPKAILTRSYAHVCKFILEDYFSDFELVVGKETTSNKVKGMELIFANPKFEPKSCLFITDTVADVVEVSKIFPKDQIFAVDWGFNQTELLEQHLPKNQIFHKDFSELLKLV